MTDPPAAAPLPWRRAWPIAGLLAGLHLALGCLARPPAIFSDQAVYVSLARSLREFHYRELFHADLPVHRMYPPVYPAVLAGWSAIGGETLDWLVIVGAAASATALLFFFAAVRRMWGDSVAIACLLALSLNAALIDSSGWLLSEAPYLFLSTLALWAASGARASPRAPAIAGAAAIAAALTRSAGVTLVLAVAAYWLWERRARRAVVFTGVAAVTVGGWLVFTALAPEHVAGSSYLGDAVVRGPGTSLSGMMLERITSKLPYAQHIYWQMSVPGTPATMIDNLFGMPLVALSVLFGLTVLARAWPAATWYLGTYAALLALWPWTVPRFITPIVPWLVLALLLGAARIVSDFRPRWRTPVIWGIASLLAIAGIQRAADIIRTRGLDAEWAGFFAALDYVRSHAPPDAVFISPAPATVYLHTGRRVVSVPREVHQRQSEFVRFARERGTTHIVLSGVGSQPASLVSANCRDLSLEARFPPNAYVFAMSDSGKSVNADEACAAAASFVRRR